MSIVDNLDDGLALIDNQRVIQVVNRQFARLLEMPPEHLPGASCDDVCPVVAPIVARTLSGGVKSFERVSHTHPSGEVITLDVYGIPLRDASGARVAAIRARSGAGSAWRCGCGCGGMKVEGLKG